MITVDISNLFLDYSKAEAIFEPGRPDKVVILRLHSGGTYATMRMDTEHMYDSLEKIRRAQSS